MAFRIRSAFILLVLLSPFAHAATVQMGIDNDVAFDSDGDYSNGVFLGYSSTPGPLSADSFLPFDTGKNYQSYWSGVIGQKMWTPSNITVVTPRNNERPYAGLLFLDTNLIISNESRSHRLGLMFGTTGPDSGAEDAQKRVHRLINNVEPRGWEYQIENKIVADVTYELDQLFYRSSGSDLRQELSGYGRLVAGNFQPEVAAGMGWRWGRGLENSFNSSALRPYRQQALSADTLRNRWYFYGSVEARYRFDDLTIKGKTLKPVPEVDVENGQMSAAIGVVYFYKSVGIGLSATANTPAFKQDKNDWHYRNALTFYWTF